MNGKAWIARIPRLLAEATVGFLSMHGALNLGIRTEPLRSLTVYLVLLTLATLFYVVGRRLLKSDP